MRAIVLASALCLATPLLVCAQSDESAEAEDPQTAEQAQPPDTRRTFIIKKTNTFACAEVAMERTGGQASHEISLGPRWIERCLLQKVGTRLHECVKLKVEKATVDQNGVVRIETDQGDVEFWFSETSVINATKDAKFDQVEGAGALEFTFPANDKKYICAPFR